MSINKLTISNFNGYFLCESSFYSAYDVASSTDYTFFNGINQLNGEIDCGIWAVSYYLSMYKKKSIKFIISDPPQIQIDNAPISIEMLLDRSVYMDKSYPLFSTRKTIKSIIADKIKYNSDYSYEDIRNLFLMDKERFDRPLTGVGNEIFNAMGAIGYTYGKDIFCFPWLSKNRFESYHLHLKNTLKTLESLNKIVILPLGK